MESAPNFAESKPDISGQYPETGQLTDFKWISQSKNIRRKSLQN
jgi:hypothetical protein